VFEWRKREVVLGTQIEFHVLWSFSDGVVRRGFYLCLSFDFTSGGRELEGNMEEEARKFSIEENAGN
jgi:hypothetical protein